MLARFFSRPQINHPIVLVAIAFATTAWGLAWISPTPQAFDFWGNTIVLPGIMGYIIGSVIWVSTAFFWQFLGKANQFVKDHFFWPVMLTLTGLLFIPSPNYLIYCQHLAGFSLLVGMLLYRLNSRQPYFAIFDLGLLMGVWILFMPFSIMWLPLLWAGILIFGLTPVRGLMLLIVGILTSLFLTETTLRSIDFFGGTATSSISDLAQRLEWSITGTPALLGIAMSVILLYIAPEVYRSVSRSTVRKRQMSAWGIVCLLLLIPLQGFLGTKPTLMAPVLLFSSLFLANQFAFNKSRWREAIFYIWVVLFFVYPVLWRLV